MPCVKSGARAGSLYRNLVAHALTLGASGDRAPVRQQPCSDMFILLSLSALLFCVIWTNLLISTTTLPGSNLKAKWEPAHPVPKIRGAALKIYFCGP